MKIAILSGDIPPTTFIDRLVVGLAKNNQQVFLFGKKKKKIKYPVNVKQIGFFHKNEKFTRFWYVTKYSFLLFLNDFKNWKKIRQLKHVKHFDRYALLCVKPDILHIQWAKSVLDYFWVKQFNIKLVVSLRGAHINYSPLADKDLADRYRQIFPSVDGFHGVSKAICEESRFYGVDLKKCQVVYSGFDLNDFPRPEIRINDERLKSLKLISVGRAHWKKGYHYALDAVNLLKEDDVMFEYDIIGVENDEELSFQVDQLQLQNEVRLYPNLPFNQVLEKISQADVLILPSVEEGIANVVIEAMLRGTPVITTNCGGMEELVTHDKNGFVVPVRNPFALAEAIKRYISLSNDQVNALREQAYVTACSQHNEIDMVQGILSLYQRVMAIENS